MKKLKLIWGHILVFFGYRVWVHMKWNRPKYARCAYHGCSMKRGRKVPKGALYYCPQCDCEYLLECGGNKLVPTYVR
jgi:hypothetical protein